MKSPEFFKVDDKPIEILLVEDNPGDVRLTMESLKETKTNNHMNVVKDGVEAMSYLYKEGKYRNAPNPDLILLDLNLPYKNGMEVLNEIKNNENLKDIPVIILTSSESEKDIIKGYNMNINSYMIKPIDAEQISLILSAICKI